MANVDNTYYRTYDANNKSGDFDDHDIYLSRNTTGNNILKELTKGDPFKGVVNLVNTAKQFNIKSELTSILTGSTNIPLDSMIGRIANTDNYKFQYGINDLLIDKDRTLYRNYVDKIEDPTILTFVMEMDEINSPLFQDDINDFILTRRGEFQSENVVSLEGQNQVISSNIGGLYDETQLMLDEFRNKIREIFTSYQSKTNSVYSKSYYINSVGGIGELDKVWTGTGEGDKYEFSRLKLEMREDVKMTARNLYFLYNSLRMHRRSGKMLIPENLLRFNMWIKISEIRNFTSLRFAVESGANIDIIDAIKRDVTAIYYYVQDCTFDFSKLHRDKYSVEDASNYETLEFDILFRRAYRVFKPTLLKAEESANAGPYFGIDERTSKAAFTTKQYALPNFTAMNIGNAVRPSLMPELNTFVRQQDPINSRTAPSASSKQDYNISNGGGANTTQSIFQSLGKFLSTGQVNLNPNNQGGLVGKALNLASQAVTRLAQSAKNTVIQKRNQLVRDLENKVKNQIGFGVPRPKNVYKPGDGSGVIGNTLESLSKATGIDFLAIREGRNIQSFSNTDIQTLNPALKGRDILTGPGGDYSKINPNSVSDNQEIADVTPDANFTMIPPETDLEITTNYVNGKIVSQNKHNLYQEISGLSGFGAETNLKTRSTPNENINPSSSFKSDTSILKDVTPIASDVKDLSLLKNVEGKSDFKPDTNILNQDLHPDSNFKNDTSILKDIVPDGNDIKDVSKLAENLQTGLRDQRNIDVLNFDLQPSDNFKNDTSLLKDLTPDNIKNPNNVDVLNTNLQSNAQTLTNKVSFKNVYKDDKTPLRDLNLLKNNLDTSEKSKSDISLLNNDLHPKAENKNDILKGNIYNENSVKVENVELGKIDTTSKKTDIELGKIDTEITKTKEIDLNKIDTTSNKNKSND